MAMTPEQQAQLQARIDKAPRFIVDNFGGEDELRRRMEEEHARKQSLKTLEHGDDLRNMTRQGLLDAQGRQAPQATGTRVGQVQSYGGATIDQASQGQARDIQMDLVRRLGGVADGSQMGAGQMAVQREANRAVAQQQAMARMGRGGNAVLAAHSAATNTANIGVNAAGQAQQAQVQDAQIANQTRAQLLDSARSQDIGLATSQAGFRQQAGLATMDAQNQRVFQQAGLNQATSLANMQARLQQTGMNDQAALNYLQQLYGIDETELQARLAMEGKATGQSTGRQLLGGALVAGGTIIGGIYGGPAGAAAGGAAGGAVNNAV